MSGKQIFIFLIVAVLLGSLIALILSKQNKTTNPAVQNQPVSPTLTETKFLDWNDQAGFAFQYPEGLTVDQHPDDTVNYANLTFTDTSGPGSIIILMQDDTFKSLDKWVNSDSKLKAGSVIDTSLGEKDGKKVLVGNQETIIGVIDNGVLVTIKKDADLSPLLTTTWDKIINTWQFIYPTPTTGTQKPATIKTINPDSDGGNVLEEDD